MRKVQISVGEYYHLYNRGMQKQPIFSNDSDRARLLFLLLYLQSTTTVSNVGYHAQHFIKHSVFDKVSMRLYEDILNNRQVELVAFCFMPNHFHLVVYEKVAGGIARYMQRVQNGYTKYFNTKYKKAGHLFQGPYQAVHVADDRQLLHLSAYLHRNPKELAGWEKREHEYPWSSYQDYIKSNRWNDLLKTDVVLGQFKTIREYSEFVDTSPAKDNIYQTLGV